MRRAGRRDIAMAGQTDTADAAIAQSLTTLAQADVGVRLWQKDAGLWSDDPQTQASIRNRLGWLNVVADVRRSGLEEITTVANAVRAEGFTDAVVLGMGGSSLCPDVCRATFGTAPGWLQLHVLDSTHPIAVQAVHDAVDVKRTLFVVSSKSGTTGESNAFFSYFWDQVAQSGPHHPARTSLPLPIPARLWMRKPLRAAFVTSSAIPLTSAAGIRRFRSSAWCPWPSSAWTWPTFLSVLQQ